jgi:CDP-diglyceride synthetase
MIQRIQTVYLILAVAICMALFFMPFYKSQNADNLSKDYDNTMYLDMNLQKVQGGAIAPDTKNYIMKTINVVLILSCAGCVFMYSNRKSQLIMSRVIMVLSLLFLVYIWYCIISLRSTSQIDPNQSQHFLLGAFLPILLPILLFLTARGITHDIQLIKSADRLR